MSAPAELAARYTNLDQDEFDHLQRLLVSWGVLADLAFSDLLLLAPTANDLGGELVVLGQTRPTTGPTLLRYDMFGEMERAGDWPWAMEALDTGQVVRGVSGVPVPETARTVSSRMALDASDTGEVPELARIECVPVRFGRAPVAVVARIGPLEERRRTGRLERVYRDVYQRLSAMIASGDYPFAGEEFTTEDAPRVGDGMVVADSDGRFSYASPNAMSALHRMGVSDSVEGRTLSDLGLESEAVERAIATGAPVIEEVECRPDVIVLFHCTPLVEEGRVTGVMVLLRDVTDLRRLDRLLLSKDAAIREVHHRVKNNLQTISSLLRLQARRLEPGKGQEALREAERRVRSIALVHEILSREPGDEVPFDEIMRSIVRMAEDSVVGGHVEIAVRGDIGGVPADVATPLAVVLAELLQNAVEHAFPTVDDGNPISTVGHVAISLSNDGYGISIEVVDDGCGLPPGFDLERSSSLGLSIVRDLVTSQLGGMIEMTSNAVHGVAGRPHGTTVNIDVPLREQSGAPVW